MTRKRVAVTRGAAARARLRAAALALGALVALAALATTGCGGREAELVIRVKRGPHAGGLSVYVCDSAPSSPCKRADVFTTGVSDGEQTIGVFIDEATGPMQLNFQLENPAACGHFDVTPGDDAEITVTLGNQGGIPIFVMDCSACTPPDTACTYAGRP